MSDDGTMAIVLGCITLALLANLLTGAVVLARRTGPVDRIAIGQFFSTLTVAALLVLGEMSEDDSLRLVALALALLGAMTVGALVRVRSGAR